MNEDIARRYQELDFYLRQSRAECDVKTLDRTVVASLGLMKGQLD